MEKFREKKELIFQTSYTRTGRDVGQQHRRVHVGHGFAAGRTRGRGPVFGRTRQTVRAQRVLTKRSRRIEHNARPGQRASRLQHGKNPRHTFTLIQKSLLETSFQFFFFWGEGVLGFRQAY